MSSYFKENNYEMLRWFLDNRLPTKESGGMN